MNWAKKKMKIKNILVILILVLVLLSGCETNKEKVDIYKSYISEAVERQDISFCDKIPEPLPDKLKESGLRVYEVRRGRCYISVAEAKKDPSICDMISQEPFKEECYHTIAPLKRDTSICGRIKDQTYKNDCYRLVALETGDASLCDLVKVESGDKEVEKQEIMNCYNSLAVMTKNPSVCAEMKDQEWRDSCYQQLTINYLHDVSLCDKIETEGLDVSQDICYYGLGTRTIEPSICAKIKKQDLRDYCYYELVRVYFLDDEISICDKIEDENQRNKCYGETR